MRALQATTNTIRLVLLLVALLRLYQLVDHVVVVGILHVEMLPKRELLSRAS